MSGIAQVQALTHTGAVRNRNEDAVAVDDWICTLDLDRPKGFELDLDTSHAVLVADGMGGHPGGDVASRAAVTFCAERAHAIMSRDDGERLLDDVNAHLYDLMAQGEGAPGMGTTLAGLVLQPRTLILVNVGDSKIYRHNDVDGLVQLSHDDTPGPKLADGRTAARNSPMLSQTLGGQLRETPITPHAELMPPHGGDAYLVCSDGLSDLVGTERLEEILTRSESDAGAVTALFEDAMAHGGRDNVSIALLRIV